MDSKTLVHQLRQASDLYYTKGTSPMTDDQYDAAVELLRRIDPANKYLAEIGPEPTEGSRKIYHVVPMGTLSKYHTDEEVIEWLRKNVPVNQGFLLSPKYDGFGVELVYIQGKLVSASTRGTGYVGEDILEPVSSIPNVPKLLKSSSLDIVVRGEVIIPREYRSLMEERGYKSLRNAVPGIVRSNLKELLVYTHFVAYNAFGDWVSRTLHSQKELREVLERYNFEVESYEFHNDFVSAKKAYEFIRDHKGTYEYDGVVLKVDNAYIEDALVPVTQIAWKFQSKVQVTPLRKVEYQLGATGKFTPIAIFDPVVFQGATITRASLGSYARFKSLVRDGMKVGSLIAVTRQGDIIPYVQEVVSTEETAEDILELSICPYCGDALIRNDKECLCVNKSCKELLKLKISSFVSCAKVKGIGSGVVNKLVDAGYFKNSLISDIYRIDPESVVVSGWGESMIAKWTALQLKKFTLLEILSFYPFDNCGSALWKKFLSGFESDKDSIEFLQDLSEGKVSFSALYSYVRDVVKGIGDEKFDNIMNQLHHCSLDLLSVIEYAHRTVDLEV